LTATACQVRTSRGGIGLGLRPGRGGVNAQNGTDLLGQDRTFVLVAFAGGFILCSLPFCSLQYQQNP